MLDQQLIMITKASISTRETTFEVTLIQSNRSLILCMLFII